MLPHISQFGVGEGGVRRVIEAYHKYLPEFGIDFVGPEATSYDLIAVHAGTGKGADVAHNHGLYWTADLELTDYEWQANVAVINSLREAKQITVPSEWVAETIRRDMRLDPHVIGHGIEWDQWQAPGDEGGYVLWNKNRNLDVCNPEAVLKLARLFPSQLFLSTFAPNPTPNLRVTGQVLHEQMRQYILGCSVYLSSTKETFGIGTLEAMAAGKPVLGWANGGNLDLVQHGVNGYLAQPGNYEDLANGLDYCLEYRQVLGENGREMAKGYTWQSVCEQVARVYEMAYSEKSDRPTVGVVIPVYNKTEDEIMRAIESAAKQTYEAQRIIVVNDGSSETSGIHAVQRRITGDLVLFAEQPNKGVAEARNLGIAYLSTKYVCTLDADDWIDSNFLETCVTELERDPTIGIAYTGLQTHAPDGNPVSQTDEKGKALPVKAWWPGEYDAARQFNYQARGNQIPSCCVFRRDAWARVGGYRSRYCPTGAGSEDAAFWSQVLSIGYTAKKVSKALMVHYQQGGHTSRNYSEIDWLAWLPFSRDKRYPFACSAPPAHFSHPVRQYDEPELSIIIPVGPGHEDDLRTALDSIEAQHFRNWETIVVFDTGNDYYPDLAAAYPYVKWGSTGKKGKKGAGFARNRGAELARGEFLLFLDADDFLNPAEPNALGEMLMEFHNTGYGVYSAHIGRAVVSAEYANHVKTEKRLMAWNETLGQAYILNHGAEFDCERAVKEPGDDPNKIYIWNLISTLIPRQWHFDVGGFDESMPTWEDWDYWVRMAKAGQCFTRIQKPFIIYNYISGNRREIGRQIWVEVLQYLKEKHEGIQVMACCGGKRKTVSGKEVQEMSVSEDFEEAWYTHPNTGRHSVIVSGYNYGRHVGGSNEHFPVRKSDIESNPHLFRPFVQAEMQVTRPPGVGPVAPLDVPPAPVMLAEPIELAWLKPKIQRILRENNLTDKQDVRNAGYDGLVAIKGIGPATARQVMELAQ